MTLRAKVRGQMRTVSPAMARRLRAKGVEVVDGEVRPVRPVTLPPLPEQPLPNMVAPAVEPVLPPVLPDAHPFDLSDEELEQLTKPDGE